MNSYVVVLLVIIVINAGSTNGELCPKRVPMQNKCKGSCIGRVSETYIDWDQVGTTSFTVRWTPVRGAQCYYIQLLLGYTIHVLRNISCHEETSYEFSGLKPARIYGVQISAVNINCKRGRAGLPARTRTHWAPTTAPRTTTPSVPYPEPGACGRRKFTCASNEEECIPIKEWCNKRIDCLDASDERGCPGGCEEIDAEMTKGNFSCTRWGSPGSICLFDCEKPYVRDGSYYTECEKKTKKWTFAVPTCRLPATESISVMEEESTATSLKLKWKPVEEAARYIFLAKEITSAEGKNEAVMRIKSVNSEECCTGVITDLKPGTDFEIIMRAVDESDVDGMKSRPVLGRTADLEKSEEKEDGTDEE